ncbi:MAG TPA: TIGR04255 family protein [Steroidobacteraceae bacterium]|jgi:uncharacterized protein (TIGR04255 family)
MAEFRDDEKYPNQPLTDVACEVRFKGEMQVESQRHLFWDEIRTQYPGILVPHMQEGQAAALQHYKFRNPDSGRTVLVALNSLVLSEPKYSGHKEFIGEFSRLVQIFQKTYPKLGNIKRIGWRYVNVMPFSREDGLVPLGRILRLEISFPGKIFDKTTALELNWRGECHGGEVILRVAVINQKETSGEALLLDIDFGKLDPGPWSDVRAVVENGRKVCRGIFEDLITEDYRSYLRGEKI